MICIIKQTTCIICILFAKHEAFTSNVADQFLKTFALEVMDININHWIVFIDESRD